MILSRIAYLAIAAGAIGGTVASSTTNSNEPAEASFVSSEALDILRESVKAQVDSNVASLSKSFDFGGNQDATMDIMATAASLMGASVPNVPNMVFDDAFSARGLSGASLRTFAAGDNRIDRQCGEIIDVVADPADLTNAVNYMIGATNSIFSFMPNLVGSTYDDYFAPTEKATGRNKFSFQAKNGVRAVKICAKCSEYRQVLRPRYRDDYDAFCGGDAYGADATVSALLLVPINQKDKPGILRGPFAGSIWYRGSQSYTYDAPSSKWPSMAEGGLAALPPQDSFFQNTDLLGGMIIAGAGKVVIMPDGLGFGESSDCFKGFHIRKLYQTATVPVYLAAKKYIEQNSRCKSEINDIVSVNGYSEGGFAAVSIADALTSIGVHVPRVGAGTFSNNLVTFVEDLVGKLIADRFPLQFVWAMIIFTSSYSSTVPGIANFGDIDQGLLSEQERLRVIQSVIAGLQISDLRVFAVVLGSMTGNGSPNSNTDYLNAEMVASVSNGESLCDNPKLDKLCEALQENSMTELIKNAPWPVSLCHSPLDRLFDFSAQFPDGTALENTNFYVNDFGIFNATAGAYPNNFYGHAAMMAVCTLAFAFETIDAETPPLEMSGKCEMV